MPYIWVIGRFSLLENLLIICVSNKSLGFSYVEVVFQLLYFPKNKQITSKWQNFIKIKTKYGFFKKCLKFFFINNKKFDQSYKKIKFLSWVYYLKLNFYLEFSKVCFCILNVYVYFYFHSIEWQINTLLQLF